LQWGIRKNFTSGTVYWQTYPTSFLTGSFACVATTTQCINGIISTLNRSKTGFNFATMSTTNDNMDWIAVGF